MRQTKTVEQDWVWGTLALFVTTTGFTGFIGKNGKGGGTAGAVVAALFQCVLLVNGCSAWSSIAVAVGSFVLGVIITPYGEACLRERYGATRKRHNGDVVDHDFNQTNWDEFHGQMIAGTVAFLFQESAASWLGALVISFILFRAFDVWKPGLIGWAERNVGGSTGLMLDDTLAGGLAFALTLPWAFFS